MTNDFFCSRLDQMIDLRHPLVVLGSRLPWHQIEAALSPVFARKPRKGQAMAGSDLYGSTLELAGAGVSSAGRPRLPIRLMASLLYLKHTYNLSDEEVVARWSENVVWQYFSGQAYYTPKPPCDATQIGRFRTAIGEAGVETLLKATIDTAVQTKAVPPTEFERIIVVIVANDIDLHIQKILRFYVGYRSERLVAHGHKRQYFVGDFFLFAENLGVQRVVAAQINRSFAIPCGWLCNCHLERSAMQVRNCLQVFAIFESARGVLYALNDIVQALKNRVCQSVIEIIHDIFKVILQRLRKGFHVFIPRSAQPSYQQPKPGFGNLFVRNGVYFLHFEFHLVRPCRFSVLPVQTLEL